MELTAICCGHADSAAPCARSIHYHRIPPTYWRDRLLRVRALGLNSIEVRGVPVCSTAPCLHPAVLTGPVRSLATESHAVIVICIPTSCPMLADWGCWRARLAQMYVPWNWHAPQPGEFVWSGGRNITRFLDIAHELGLNVVLRPGPYVCAEVRCLGIALWQQSRHVTTLEQAVWVWWAPSCLHMLWE